MNTPTSHTDRHTDPTRTDPTRTDDSTNGSIDDGPRYWWTGADDHQPHTHAFGDATAQIVDEHSGGAIAYCHEDNAQTITNALNTALTVAPTPEVPAP